MRSFALVLLLAYAATLVPVAQAGSVCAPLSVACVTSSGSSCSSPASNSVRVSGVAASAQARTECSSSSSRLIVTSSVMFVGTNSVDWLDQPSSGCKVWVASSEAGVRNAACPVKPPKVPALLP